MKFQHVRTNGINLHVATDGPSEGPLVILLHGFPEFWYGWRRQIPYLAENGYQVWIPDQRGYNLSDKPAGIGAYALDQLAADVVGLMDAAGEERVFLVGHDWGAAVAWWVAGKYPQRLSRMVIINVPHGAIFSRHLRQNFQQLRKSWYMFFFQLPWLPEILSRMQDWRLLVRAMKGSSRPGTFSAEDMAMYRQAWSQPYAYTSMVNWYRAMMRRPSRPHDTSRITVPTHLIWGTRDRFLGREMAQPSIDLCDGGSITFLEEATHWVQHEQAEEVNEIIDTFFR
jgi:pimeloyl-ACP methyl ester carboxylesterase